MPKVLEVLESGTKSEETADRVATTMLRELGFLPDTTTPDNVRFGPFTTESVGAHKREVLNRQRPWLVRHVKKNVIDASAILASIMLILAALVVSATMVFTNYHSWIVTVLSTIGATVVTIIALAVFFLCLAPITKIIIWEDPKWERRQPYDYRDYYGGIPVSAEKAIEGLRGKFWKNELNIEFGGHDEKVFLLMKINRMDYYICTWNKN